MAENPKVFISYSWDSDAHRAWVRDLAERLVGNGVDVRLDQWTLVPGDSLTGFMEEQIAQCDNVLIVCTPNYAQRSTSRLGGVGYEQQIISGELATGVQRRKFIPIVRAGELHSGPGMAIPPHFMGIYAIDMRGPNGIEEQIEGLLRAIYRVPALISPPTGPKPAFALTAGNDAVPIGPVRLASIEFDGWELVSGVAMNEYHPDTFSIPSAEEREALVASDFVKLVFNIAVQEPSADDGFAVNGERMWVRLEGSYGPYLWGKLANSPIDGQEYGLSYGAEIVFLPEHVIDIDKPEQQKEEETSTQSHHNSLDEVRVMGSHDDDFVNLRPVLRNQARVTD